MKIQIDIKNKTLKIEESILLCELIKNLDSLFPNNAWKEYRLETTVITNWTNPIVIREPYVVPNTPYPWQNPITYVSSNINYEDNGVSKDFQQIYNLNVIN